MIKDRLKERILGNAVIDMGDDNREREKYFADKNGRIRKKSENERCVSVQSNLSPIGDYQVTTRYRRLVNNFLNNEFFRKMQI